MHVSDSHSPSIFSCVLSLSDTLSHHPRSASPAGVFWCLGASPSPFINISLFISPLSPHLSLASLVSVQLGSICFSSVQITEFIQVNVAHLYFYVNVLASLSTSFCFHGNGLWLGVGLLAFLQLSLSYVIAGSSKSPSSSFTLPHEFKQLDLSLLMATHIIHQSFSIEPTTVLMASRLNGTGSLSVTFVLLMWDEWRDSLEIMIMHSRSRREAYLREVGGTVSFVCVPCWR